MYNIWTKIVETMLAEALVIYKLVSQSVIVVYYNFIMIIEVRENKIVIPRENHVSDLSNSSVAVQIFLRSNYLSVFTDWKTNGRPMEDKRKSKNLHGRSTVVQIADFFFLLPSGSRAIAFIIIYFFVSVSTKTKMTKEERDYFSFFVFNFFAALENATGFEIFPSDFLWLRARDRNVFEID